MSAWEHPSRDLFRAGQGAMAPTTADRERVRARLAAKLGAAAVGAAITTTSATAGGATAAATGSAKGGLAAFIAKIAIPVLLVGGAAAFVVPHLAKNEATPVAPPAAPVVVAPHVPDPAPPPPLPRETATASVIDLPAAAPVPSAIAPARAAAKTTASDPVAEARIVAAIDDALRANDTTRALRLADEHAQKFPNGVLVEEREGARAIARCMNGSHASADVFLAAHPRSPMRARILSACGRKSER